MDHLILIRRLRTSFGVSGSVLSWLQSYLLNRTQSVSISHHSSSPTTCTSGVPQGSVLGPLLFAIYTSPIAMIHLAPSRFVISSMLMTPSCSSHRIHPIHRPTSLTSLPVCMFYRYGFVSMEWLSTRISQTRYYLAHVSTPDAMLLCAL